ncbi:MAG: hypothetical protein K2K06_12115 [Oscillospiraceae bacterium]|nr:hypothetical protein [Ruminococcus sp.]MDE6708764.1 hypothetical protein [Oscillospiraceae bacterium]
MDHINQQNLDGLLKVVSQKLGIPPEQLQQELKAGKFDNAIKNMSQSDASKFQQAIKNPQIVEKLMSTPQAKAIYQKLTGGQ